MSQKDADVPQMKGDSSAGESVYISGGTLREAPRISPVTGLPVGDNDALHLDREELTTMGVPEDSVPYWYRDTKDQFWRDDTADRIADAKRNGGDIVRDAKGVPVRCGRDLILGYVPRAVWDKQQAETDRQQAGENAKLSASIEEADSLESDESIDFIPEENKEVRKRLLRASHNANIANGLINQANKDVNPFDVMRKMGKEAVLSEQARYRNGGRHQGMSDDAWGDMWGTENNKKSFGVGAGLGNRNPNSAVAQAARAAKRKG